MTCFQPKTIYIKKAWELNQKEEYIKYKSDKPKNKKIPYEIKQLLPKWKPSNSHYGIEIPCGKCLGCRLDHANDWATRMYMEAKLWKENCFVTLTYNDKNLPKNKQLAKNDIIKFFKLLKYYEEGNEEWTNPNNGKIEKPIRRLYCGEYGEKHKRPHYHAAIYNYKPKDLKPYKQNHQGDMLYTSKTLQKIWGKGFVIIGDLSYKSACYIARYVQKKQEYQRQTGGKIKMET